MGGPQYGPACKGFKGAVYNSAFNMLSVELQVELNSTIATPASSGVVSLNWLGFSKSVGNQPSDVDPLI